MTLEMSLTAALPGITLATLSNCRNTFEIDNVMFVEHLKVKRWIFHRREGKFAN